MIDKKTELTNEDIRAVFDPMFNTGKVWHRTDLVNAVIKAYPNLSSYYFELVGSEKHKKRLYDKCNIVLNSYKRQGKIRNVEPGKGSWQSTSVKFK